MLLIHIELRGRSLAGVGLCRGDRLTWHYLDAQGINGVEVLEFVVVCFDGYVLIGLLLLIQVHPPRIRPFLDLVIRQCLLLGRIHYFLRNIF